MKGNKSNTKDDKSKKKQKKISVLKNKEFMDTIEKEHYSLGTDVTDVYQKISDLLFCKKKQLTIYEKNSKGTQN